VKADDGMARAELGGKAGQLQSLGPSQGGHPRKGVLVGQSMSRGSEEGRREPWCLLCLSDSRAGEKKGRKGVHFDMAHGGGGGGGGHVE
jgi:hypothetical protein